MASLVQRSNGYFYFITYLRGKRIWKSTGSKSRSGALKYLENKKRQSKQLRNLTLSQFRTQYITFAKANLAPSTVTLYNGAINTFIRYAGDLLLTEYTPQIIEQYKITHSKKVSLTKVNIDFRSLKSVFSTAVTWNLIEENPFRKCKQVRLPQMRPIFLTPDDFKKLLNTISYDWFKDLVRFAVSTMMRVGEIVNLKWSSIDLERRLILVENTDEFRTKTRKSRVIPMNEWTYYFLLQKERKSDRVFTFPDGKSLRVGYVSTTFTKFVRKTPIDQRIHFHSLRHTGATWLVQKDVPIFTVQRVLGHSSVATTQIYSHLGVDDMRRSVGELNSIIESTN